LFFIDYFRQFDYLFAVICVDSVRVNCIVDYTCVNYGFSCSGLAIAHSRKVLATLGGSTSTRTGVRKITIKTYDFIDISNATIPTALGGSTTTSPPIVIVILRQQLAYLYIINYDRASDGAPDKS
jgi:hypothetical protein